MAIKSKEILRLYGVIEQIHDECLKQEEFVGCSNCPFLDNTCFALGDLPMNLDLDGIYEFFEQLEELLEKRKE